MRPKPNLDIYTCFESERDGAFGWLMQYCGSGPFFSDPEIFFYDIFLPNLMTLKITDKKLFGRNCILTILYNEKI